MRRARRALPHPSRHGGLTTHPRNPSGRTWRLPSRRWLSWRLLLGRCLRRGALRWLGARGPLLRLPVLRVPVRGVPGLLGPGLCPCAGLPAADAGDRGSGSPAGGVLCRRLLPSPGRWRDGRLFLDLGAGRAATGSAEPLGHALHRSCLGSPWWTVAARSSFLPVSMETASPQGCRHAGSTDHLGLR